MNDLRKIKKDKEIEKKKIINEFAGLFNDTKVKINDMDWYE